MEEEVVNTRIWLKMPMQNNSNKPNMEVEGNRTTRKTSMAAQNTDGTYRLIDILFYCCFRVLGGYQ